MKNKLLIIAAAALAVILVVVGIVVAVALNNSYLDKIKGDNMASVNTYNGVEIIEKDGLFYLTKDGKKLSKTGYSFISDVNTYYDSDTAADLAYNEAKDFEIYDFFVARKPDANNYLLLNTKGEEIVIAGENLMYYDSYLPYVLFKDLSTQEFAVLSLKNLDSDLSDYAENEISLNYYDAYDFGMVSDGGVQYDYLMAFNEDVSVDGNRWVYFDADGYTMFVSPTDTEDYHSLKAYEYDVYTLDNEHYERYFLTTTNKLYSLSGGLVATDVEGVNNSDGRTFIAVICESEDEAIPEAERQYMYVISATASFKLNNAEYELAGIDGDENLFWAPVKSEGEITGDYKLFNVVSGEESTYAYVSSIYGAVVVSSDDSNYTYLDSRAGAVLMASSYSDFTWYDNGVLYSPAECADDATTLDGGKYLHFVSAGKESVKLTLNEKESLYALSVDRYVAAYTISADDSYSMYIPFAAGAKTEAYDDIQRVDVFANGADVVVATKYGEKYDIIDIVNGKVLRTVEAKDADMAKTTIELEGTYVLVADEFNKESAVEIAVLAICTINDNSDVSDIELVAISRNAVQRKNDFVTSAATAISFGKGAVDGMAILASEWDYSGGYYDEYYEEYFPGAYGIDEASKYLVVNKANRTAEVYKLGANMTLEEVTTIPYLVFDIEHYSDNLDDVYFVAYNDGGKGLYDASGKQILAPAYYDITVIRGGKYIAVTNNNEVIGIYEYKAKSGKLKLVVDYMFEDITVVGVDSYVVSIGDDDFLYCGDKLVMDSRISGDILMGRNIAIDEKTGKVVVNELVVYFFDGKGYIHREDAREVVYTDFYATYHNEYAVVESGMKIVNYRDASGAIIETVLVYPDDDDFALRDGGSWYTTGEKKLQNSQTLVTKDSIVYGEDAIFNIYIGEEITLEPEYPEYPEYPGEEV